MLIRKIYELEWCSDLLALAHRLCLGFYILTIWDVDVIHLLIQQCELHGFGIRVFDVIMKMVIGSWCLFENNLNLSTCYNGHYVYSVSDFFISIFTGPTTNLPWSPVVGHS